MAPLPTGMVTFLLTDVEGSTQLWERDPSGAADAMAAQAATIGEAIERWEGARPLEQGEGDSLVAAFARVTDAVHAADVAQQSLEALGGLRVRMALHTGEVELRADGTYAGAVLNRCARLRNLAHGGQVLVSGATADLVDDHLDDGLGLRDLGTHRLRDLSRPEHVWQLTGRGLATEFPALRSLDATPNNLPVQLSSFIGRDDDIAQGRRLLAETRLLTFTGAGGCGKTRLAQRVAGEVTERFPYGVWWVELAAVTDPTLVASAVADVMSLRVPPERAAADVVTDHLGDDPVLVVLDNCEHLIEAAARFADGTLRACPGVVVLATSREPLGIEGEVSWRVPSLGLPPVDHAEPATLEQYDAVRLFIERAVQSRPHFTVDNENAPAVAQICHRLDGIPLAIELAAARIRTLPPERIAAELDDRFRLLAGGSRVALPRQQTLFASVDWSHALLEEHERAVLRRLATFVDGFTIDAAEAVASFEPVDAYEVMDVVGRLVDKSLVQADDVGGTRRYRLLETIRQYAADRRAEAGEDVAAAERHLAWATAHAERHLEGATNSHADALDALDAEHANLDAALRWALQTGQADESLHLVELLGLFWAQRGHYAGGAALAAAALELAPGADPLVAARARWSDAYVKFYAGTGDSLEAGLAALEAAVPTGDLSTIGRCRHTIGTSMLLGDPEQARGFLDEALADATAAGDEWCLADANQMVAFSHLVQGSIDDALPYLEAARAISTRLGNDFQAAWHHDALAMVAGWRGDMVPAALEASLAIAAARRVGDPTTEVWCAMAFTSVLAEAGDMTAIAEIEAEMHEDARERGELSGALLAAMSAAGRLHADPAGAADLLGALADGLAEVGDLADASQLWCLAASARLDLGDLAAARSVATRLRATAAFRSNLAFGSIFLAACARIDGDEHADDLAHEALSILAGLGHVLPMPRVFEVLGGIALDAGAGAEAVRLLAFADALGARIGRQRSPVGEERFAADVAAARDGLAEGFDEAWSAGAALELDDAVAYARRARGERGRPSFGWASLTPTERRCVDLVAEGLTNPEIGERLFIGRGTVKTHLAHAFTKLGVRSRSELAAEVTRRATG